VATLILPPSSPPGAAGLTLLRVLGAIKRPFHDAGQAEEAQNTQDYKVGHTPRTRAVRQVPEDKMTEISAAASSFRTPH
jgi:hypothetical protein